MSTLLQRRAYRPAVISGVMALAWPAIVEQTLMMTVGIIDTAMVGRLGAVALASVGLGAQVMMIAITCFAAVSTGTSALVARFTGASEVDKACTVARQSLLLGTLLAVIMSFFLYFNAEAIVHVLFRTSATDVLALAVAYIKILSLSVVPNFILIIINAVLRGSGDTRTPMLVMAVVNVINVMMNYLLIFGIGPLPRLEVRGAAIASAIAQTCGGLIVTCILFSGKTLIRLGIHDDYRPDFPTIRRILRIGIPAGLEQALMRAGQTIYTVIVSSLGTVAYAAHQIALNAESISFMPGFGFALAATTLVGQKLGAGEPREAERAGLTAAGLAAGIMSLMGAAFFLFPALFVSIFTHDAEVLAASAQVLRLIALSQPFLALSMVLAGGLRGAGDTRSVMWITGFGICAVRVCLALLFVRLGYGLFGAWMAMAIDLVFRGTACSWRFRQGRWKNTVV
ncbi:MAG TPA: MATE family efflux transporter [Firmicutes bacterium]|nr:MATE family efflux transporter [Bacillota bacterium]